jgi:phosphoribosyl 1,2-cyclic phosphate phosphodiesterase
MRIEFLGTGTSQGVPPIGCHSEVCRSEDPRDKRLRTSVHIHTGELSLVVDSGPDFRYQMLRSGIESIDGLLFTHEHRDHTAGLDDIRAFNYMQGDAIDAYLHPRVLQKLHLHYDYIFDPNPYPGIPIIRWHEIGLEPFDLKGQRIVPIEVMHYRLPVLGFRVNDFSYVTDANYIHERELEKLKGSKVLVLNALRRESHISHFTLDEAVEVAKLVGAEQTFFTHMSHQIGLHAEVNASLPAGMALAHDGLVLEWND